MDLVKQLPLAFLVSLAWAQGLSLTIGNSVAGQNYATKSASFVFRVNGCADLSKAQVTATAEGIVAGARQSTPLKLAPIQPPGVYAISQQWGNDGNWVVAVTAACLKETAAAIVPVNGRGFVRESTRMLPHAPSQAEIEAALKAAPTQ
jgi:hypothetical protein